MKLSVSKRGIEMPPSPIRKLVPYAEAAKKKGIQVYHLNIGQPDIETPKELLSAVQNAQLKILEYSHSAGNESYRKKLVQYYQRNGIEIDFSQILITTGGSEAILFAFMACLDADDEVIVPEPFYANYNGFATEAGVRIVPVTSSIQSGFSLPALEKFEAAITHKTKAVLICNPNNPTGYLYSKKELEQLKEFVIKHNLYLFSDEAYREFCYEGTHVSALQLEGIDEHVVLLDTISKRYSACGARIGAFITRNEALLQTALKFAQARLSPPTLEQILAEAAIDLAPNYFDAIKQEYLLRRNLLVQRLQAMPQVVCPNPGGAFYAMAQLPVADTDVFCQWLLEEFQYHNQTIMMAPGSGFYSNAELGKKEVRLAYVLQQENIQKAMDCLEEALKIYKQ